MFGSHDLRCGMFGSHDLRCGVFGSHDLRCGVFGHVVSGMICVLHSLGLSYWKDGIVLILLTLCIILSLWAVFQRRHTQKRVDCFLEESRVYEKELNELKKK